MFITVKLKDALGFQNTKPVMLFQLDDNGRVMATWRTGQNVPMEFFPVPPDDVYITYETEDN